MYGIPKGGNSKMNEIWKAINGYSGYEISNMGRVRSYRNNHGGVCKRPQRFLTPSGKRYFSVSLVKEQGKGSDTILVHKLIAEAFIGPRPVGAVICHNNGDRYDNRASNLRYDTPFGNMLDATRHGQSMAGQKSYTSKLSTKDVLMIRDLYSTGEYTQDSLAKLFPVGRTAIGSIIRGDSWKNLYPKRAPSHRESAIVLSKLVKSLRHCPICNRCIVCDTEYPNHAENCIIAEAEEVVSRIPPELIIGSYIRYANKKDLSD